MMGGLPRGPAAGIRPAACGLLALLLAAAPVLAAPVLAAPGDTRAVLSGLVGRSKADVIQRLGPPSDTVTTVDGERLFYETLDAGLVNGRSGQETRANEPRGVGLFPRTYSFRCKTEIVIRDGRVQAFNRSGNDCH